VVGKRKIIEYQTEEEKEEERRIRMNSNK